MNGPAGVAQRVALGDLPIDDPLQIVRKLQMHDAHLARKWRQSISVYALSQPPVRCH
jgi:hypothetical protein